MGKDADIIQVMNGYRMIVCSDSHGDRKSLEMISEIYGREWILLHCGDSCILPEELERYGFLSVQGNNDFPFSFPDSRILKYGGHSIYMCHGHRDMFFNRYDMLADRALQKHCDIALCGHSHIYHEERVKGVLCLNPGSLLHNRDLSAPSYMTLCIDGEQIEVERKKLSLF